MTPSVQVSLDPDGGLQVGLPGPFGALRWIPLRHTASCDPTATIKMILDGLTQGQSAIGLDGAPTRAQVRHWERHQTFSDDRCPFCTQLGFYADALAPTRCSHTKDLRYAPRDIGNGASVRRIPAGQSAKAAQAKAARRGPKPLITQSPKSTKQLFGF